MGDICALSSGIRKEWGERVSLSGASTHLFQLTPHAHPSIGHSVREDEVQFIRADAQSAGFGKLGYHVTNSYSKVSK